MTYVTIGLPAGGAVVEVQTPERLIHMRGGKRLRSTCRFAATGSS